MKIAAAWLLVLVPLLALLVGSEALQPDTDQGLPPGFHESIYVGGLIEPTSMAFAPDGRLFVTEQTGALRVVKDGRLLPDPFLRVQTETNGERGLLGVTFDPDFFVNQYVYIYYTAVTPTIHNRVSRFVANGNVAMPGSETIILDLPTLDGSFHNGGALHFGPDGKLYIGVGENGSQANAQRTGTPMGKILRIDADGTIPSDNPFYTSTIGDARAIWAYGLRNPFSFAFQPGTGRLFANDVGLNTWEEVNEIIRGSNYGWPTTEGPTTNPAFRTPVFAYGRNQDGVSNCGIVGAAFYEGSLFPSEYANDYFFGDFCSGWIRRLNTETGAVTPFLRGTGYMVDIDVGPDGALYYLRRPPQLHVRSTTPADTVRRISHPGNAIWASQNACLIQIEAETCSVDIRWHASKDEGVAVLAQASDGTESVVVHGANGSRTVSVKPGTTRFGLYDLAGERKLLASTSVVSRRGTTAWLNATPSTCAAADSAVCSTRISWYMNSTHVEVTVQDTIESGEIEFASGAIAIVEVPWIKPAPHSYVFRLYDFSDGTRRFITAARVNVRKPVGASVTASPAACQTQPEADSCAVQIQWESTGLGAPVLVSSAGASGPETAVAQGASGSIAAPITSGTDAMQRFRLYEALSGSRVLMAEAVVTASATRSATLTAQPNPCTLGPESNCATRLSWSTQGVSAAEITVAKVGETSETLFGLGTGGSAGAPWISGLPDLYVFRLYDTSDGTRSLIASITVFGSDVP